MEKGITGICEGCRQPFSITYIKLDGSASGYTLAVSGVPAVGCRDCGTQLMMSYSGTLGLDAIILAIINALESIAPVPAADTRGQVYHCRHCKARLPDSVDRHRAHFSASAGIGRTSEIIGIEYFGDAITCPSCATKHPHLPSTLYHKIKDSVSRAAEFYLPH
jgi:ribosomal protein L40E